jgi:hypothetical protein
MGSRRLKQLPTFTEFFKANFNVKHATELINAIKRRGDLRDNLKKLCKVTRRQQAHHIIPVEAVKECRLMQKAVLGGFRFNGSGNGIPLSLTKHKKRHRQLGEYNRYVLGELLHLESKLPTDISFVRARLEVEILASKLSLHFD